jgi:Protein of unknown function (DUF3141)/AI-2E family transporter
VGHLGIFVSGGVAKKEHGEFSSNIDLIDTLPPGLYEAVFEARAEDTANPNLMTGNWVMRCEARTLDDIRALGGNDAADERRFATAARVSEINLALYRTFAHPMVRGMVGTPLAEWMQQMHPLRLQYELFSDANPMMAPVAKFLGGLGFVVAGIPAAGFLSFLALVLGIVQIGPAILFIPIVVWSWMAMETTSALIFTAYMIPVGLVDNVLRPLVMARGLNTPMPVILIGVIGGTIAYGISGLFLGPIVLSVAWALIVAWTQEDDAVVSGPQSECL